MALGPGQTLQYRESKSCMMDAIRQMFDGEREKGVWYRHAACEQVGDFPQAFIQPNKINLLNKPSVKCFIFWSCFLIHNRIFFWLVKVCVKAFHTDLDFHTDFYQPERNPFMDQKA